MSTTLRLSALGLLAVSLAACDGDGDHTHTHSDSHSHSHHHDETSVEIHTRGTSSAHLASWDADHGWRDADGNDIDTLPTPVDTEAGLEEFEAFGERTSLTVLFFDAEGDEIEMSTVSRDDDSQERVCSEYSGRYYAVDDHTDVIAWPPVPHPDGPEQSYQFVELSGEEYAGIYHCNHVHIYPKEAGTAEVEFVLWHGDHGDDWTDPIKLSVEPAD